MKLLEERSRQEGKRIVVTIGNAKYHHAKMHKSWREEQKPDFALDYLPPYSPDLSPIERVWKPRVGFASMINVFQRSPASSKPWKKTEMIS